MRIEARQRSHLTRPTLISCLALEPREETEKKAPPAMSAPDPFLALAASLFLILLSSLSAPSPAAAASGRVSVAVYYESLCPFCTDFIVNRLPRIFSDGLISAVDLRLVPFGNAELAINTSISCQHGPEECFFNAVEACAIAAWPDVREHFSFIYCVERLNMEGRDGEWESCFHRASLDPRPLVDCYNNGFSHNLELKYAADTNALQPPHKFVPWVLVNGHPIYDDYDNFEAYVCKALAGTGDRHKACGGVSPTTSAAAFEEARGTAGRGCRRRV